MFYFGYKTFYFPKEDEQFKEYDYHFVLIGEKEDDPYWQQIKNGAHKVAEEHNIYLEFVAPKNIDNDLTVKLLDQMISVQVDGIMVPGIGTEEFIHLVHKGVKRGIPIITVGSDIKNSERKAYVGLDNYHVGQLIGKNFIKNTNGNQQVGIIISHFKSKGQQERVEGFKDAVQRVNRIEIVDVLESNLTQTGAARATYTLLKEYPTLNALIGMSSLDGIGIYEGFQDISPHKDMYISAFGLLPETVKLIEHDEIHTTIAEFPYEIGNEAMELLMKLQESDVLYNQFFGDTGIITKKDLTDKKWLKRLHYEINSK